MLTELGSSFPSHCEHGRDRAAYHHDQSKADVSLMGGVEIVEDIELRRSAWTPTPSVRVYPPADHLRGYVTFYYVVESPGPVTDFLYPEWGNVRFAVTGEWHVEMPGCYPPDPQIDALFGPTDRCGTVTATGGKMAGFGMTPLGWNRLIGSDASAMANRVRPLGAELGICSSELGISFAPGTADEVGVSKLDDLLTRLVSRRPPEPGLMIKTDRVLRTRPANVPAFAAAVGVPLRTLHRLCLRTFGFAPKRLLRRQRFLDTLGHVRSAVGESLKASLDPTYNDLPHFYRDFRDFMGMSPQAYHRANRQLMAQAAAAQVEAGVTLSFQLPPQPAGRASLQ